MTTQTMPARTMTAKSYALRDSATMLRRNLLHALRYPGMSIGVLMVPLLMLLLFRFVFGDTLSAGVGAPHGGYINFLAPGVLVLTLTAGSVATAVSVSMDMTEGIINRFRTMAIARVSVLTGHVLGAVIQSVIAAVLITALAVGLGFRPDASPAGWLAALGLTVAVALAVTWVSVALGVGAKTPESASNAPTPLVFLPFLGSAFVPPESMAPGLRWFAEYQPFTPIINAMRGILLGTAIGYQGLIALAWCAGLGVVGYVWARNRFNRPAAR
jgi:ABC-2 type transport system permease protein